VTDDEIMAALRWVPQSEFDTEMTHYFMKCDPGADDWAVYEVVATGRYLVFTFNNVLTMQCIRDAYRLQHSGNQPHLHRLGAKFV
jgi:hypothetical protein